VCKELFPDVKIITMPKGDTWQFKHLIVPSMSNVSDGITTPGLAPWLRHFKGLTNIEGVKPDRKIVVLRPGAKTRRMLNSDELLLKLKGWETVTLENLSIKDQIKTFATASHVLAAHGAGMVNLLWCQPGTKVIEIQDRNMLHKKVYPLLSHNLNLDHKLYLADVVEIPREKGNKLQGVKRFSDMINFKINIPEIMEHLE
jgi:capsular polysaccharide biosynthesis protein